MMLTMTSFQLLCLLLPLAAAALPDYSETYAQYMVDFSGAAYCAGTLGHGVDNWSCGACKAHPAVTNSTVISESSATKTLNGFVAYDSEEDRIVLSISGTDPLKIKDWIDDLDFFKTDYPLCDKYGSNKCQVHEGFLASYDVGKDAIVTAIKAYRAGFPTATLHVTGHSLGAIMAVFAALDLTLEHGIVVDSILTFGQPRGGDADFSNFFEQHLEEYR